MYLGIDVGTSSVKAVLTDGSRTEKAQQCYGNQPEQGEQNPEDVGETVRLVIRRLVGNTATKERIAAIGICGHGPSVLFLGADGTHRTPIVTWQDKRAWEEAAMLKDMYPDFYKDGSSYEAKILWFAKNRPDLFRPGNTVLYPKDYLLFLLSGERVIDRSAASTACFFNPKNSVWETGVVRIPEGVFPAVVDSAQTIGRTATAYSRGCGLPDSIPLVAGGIDAFCEVLGAGAVRPGDLVDGTGTSTCLSLCTESETKKDQHVVDRQALLIKQISLSGGSVQWWKSVLGRESIQEMCEGIDPRDPVQILFLPYLIGERSPIWDENASGVFVGLRKHTTAKEMTMAILQGTAYAVRHNLDLIEKEFPAGDSIRAVGGGSGNDHWLQIKADVTGKKYCRMENPDGAALGAAILAASGATGNNPVDIAKDWVRIQKTFIPDPETIAVHRQIYNVYRGLYPQLKQSFQNLEIIGQSGEERSALV